MLEVQNMLFCSAFYGLVDKSGAMIMLFVELTSRRLELSYFPIEVITSFIPIHKQRNENHSVLKLVLVLQNFIGCTGAECLPESEWHFSP